MDTKQEIWKSVNKIIGQLGAQLEYSSGKAKLAKLRNSMGRTDLAEVYPFLYGMISKELIENIERRWSPSALSDEEKAIIWSLQFYALLQQGRSDCVHESMEYQNLGSSLSGLRTISENSKAVDRRFNAMILSDTEEEFQTHLRYMLRLYKSKIKDGTVDFAKLAMDIYRFIHREDGKEQIRREWSREYYKVNYKEEENNE